LKLRILAVVALAGLVGGMAVDMASGGDPTELTGPELGILMLENELQALRDDGRSEEDPAIVTLREDIERLQELASGPPPDPPDPERVAELMAHERSSEPEWPVGWVSCDWAWGLEELDESIDGQCASIPQDDGGSVYVAILDNGRAWVYYRVHPADGKTRTLWVDIPVISDIKSAEFEVDGAELQVVANGQIFAFDTVPWREEAKKRPVDTG